MIDWMCRDATKFCRARTSLMLVSGVVTLRPFFTCQPGDKRCFTACGIDNFEHGSKLCLEPQIHLTFNLFCRSQQTETEKNMLLSFFCFFPPFLVCQMCWRLKILPAWVILVPLHALRVSCLTPHTHLFLWPAYTQACLPSIRLLTVKAEGPNGHRLEECLPSGGENVISWDQRIRGRFLSRSLLALTFPLFASHAGRRTPLRLSCGRSLAHTRALSGGEKWHLFFQLFPLFSHNSGLGHKR